MKKVIFINGSYRQGGVSDQVLDAMVSALSLKKVDCEVVQLRDRGLQFCTNCRMCAQKAGDAPGECVLEDDFNTLVASLEKAEGFVLLCPTNFGTVTALFKQFIERLIVYGYYPWGAKGPQHRKRTLTKKAIIVTSCAAPSFVNFLFGTKPLMKKCATLLGANVVGVMRLGKVSLERDYVLNEKQTHEAARLMARLVYM
jgi:multimeric flavodoxin WrbA